ncbi:MAG: zinc-binding alcohol dehydrogenase family protein [Spirochaetaceae bacterium]|nr:zinc-binding alcohol dehydrogenase family protein [Spirochaetaceae bacterium]
MKVGVVEKPGVLKIEEREEPKLIQKTDVLISVKRVGVCGSDIHIFHGKNPFAVYPRVWGHEFTGEVIAAGSSVTKVKTGDHVVVEPIISCGSCYACRQNRPNVCEKLQVMGVHIDGGCQEKFIAPESNVHLLPKELPWEEACLVEPFTIGAQAAYRGNIQPGDFVLVMGAGTIGLTVAQMAKLAGAIVMISDVVESKLNYAKERGADYIINAAKENVMEKVKEITGGTGANVTVDAVCNKKSFEDAILLTSTAGRVVELSFNEIPSEIAPVNIIKKEITVCGSRLQTHRFPVVVDAIQQGKLPLKGFVTKTYPFRDMIEAFDFVDKNNASVRKILISFE